MAVTYDEMSELRIAFHEAMVPADRRRSQRIRQQIPAEISPWRDNRAGTAFGVMVEDFSTTGVGIVHSGRLVLGSEYLLEIPRRGQRPFAVIFTAVRCNEVDGGLFSVQMEPSEILDVAVQVAERTKHVVPKESHSRAIVILFAFLGTAAAVYFGLF